MARYHGTALLLGLRRPSFINRVIRYKSDLINGKTPIETATKNTAARASQETKADMNRLKQIDETNRMDTIIEDNYVHEDYRLDEIKEINNIMELRRYKELRRINDTFEMDRMAEIRRTNDMIEIHRNDKLREINDPDNKLLSRWSRESWRSINRGPIA